MLQLELTRVASATDAAIQKRIYGSGTTALIISNEENNDIKKIVKSLEESDLVIKAVNETIENKAKEQRGGFLGMLLGTLAASWLGNMLTSKGIIRAGEGVVIKLVMVRTFNAALSFI